MALGRTGLATVVAAAALVAVSFRPTAGGRVDANPTELERWPQTVEVVAVERVVGSTAVSVETASPVDRVFIVLRPTVDAQDLAIDDVADHLDTIGWQLATSDLDSRWYHRFGAGPGQERLYLGPLDDFLASTGAFDDRRAPERLQEVAGPAQDQLLIQIYLTG